MNIFQHIYYAIRQGDWSAGFDSRKTWEDKPYFLADYTYYDGNHACIHIWYFWVSVFY